MTLHLGMCARMINAASVEMQEAHQQFRKIGTGFPPELR